MQNKFMRRAAPIVTLTTDFGGGDYYVGAMKGVILGIAPEAQLVDISHQIPPQDVLAAAFVLRHAAREFPPGTVHLAVVDPGVGTRRRPLALQSSGHLWVGPDNGLFSFVLDRADSRVHEIVRPDLGRPDPSSTFHGRDLFAPLAAHLCRGLDLADIGPPVADPVRLDESAPCKSADRIAGHIVHIDGFGNLVSNIAAAILRRGVRAAHPPRRACVYGTLPHVRGCRAGRAACFDRQRWSVGNCGQRWQCRPSTRCATPRYSCRRKALRKKKFMSNAPLIVSISGIRGLVGQSLTDEVVARFAAAFGTTLTPGDTVVLARDTRPSGAAFAQAAAAALRQTGCRVVDVGMCSTPGAKLMISALDAKGAIIITASHNPAPWNGLKLVRADGVFLNAEEGARVEALFHAGEFRCAASGELETIDSDAVVARHVQQIVDYVDADAIRRPGFKVAVDPCNGTGGLVVPSLLDALGVEATLINARPDGDFAHDPEPVPANLVQLGQAVRDNGCAIGFAIDPDADRVALVDSSGTPVGEDYTLALAVQAAAARQPGPVVTTLSTSQAVTDAATAHNCPVFLTAVGEVHVVEKMMAEEAVIGGEGNGGVIVTQIGPSRDAALGLALVLEAMACTGRSLEELIAALPSYAIDKRKITCTPEQLDAAIAALRDRYPEAYVHPVRDGSKLYLSGQLECPWVHLRASNTEPIVRVIAESASAAEAALLCDEVEGLFR